MRTEMAALFRGKEGAPAAKIFIQQIQQSEPVFLHPNDRMDGSTEDELCHGTENLVGPCWAIMAVGDKRTATASGKKPRRPIGSMRRSGR
jgi:hypothetical protein